MCRYRLPARKTTDISVRGGGGGSLEVSDHAFSSARLFAFLYRIGDDGKNCAPARPAAAHPDRTAPLGGMQVQCYIRAKRSDVPAAVVLWRSCSERRSNSVDGQRGPERTGRGEAGVWAPTPPVRLQLLSGLTAGLLRGCVQCSLFLWHIFHLHSRHL